MHQPYFTLFLIQFWINFTPLEMDSDKCAQSKCGNIVDLCVYHINLLLNKVIVKGFGLVS